jgi:hypothetical protein
MGKACSEVSDIVDESYQNSMRAKSFPRVEVGKQGNLRIETW